MPLLLTIAGAVAGILGLDWLNTRRQARRMRDTGRAPRDVGNPAYEQTVVVHAEQVRTSQSTGGSGGAGG